MKIEFDPEKDAQNVRERRVSLRLGGAVLANIVGEFEDTRRDYGERRMVAFGVIAGRLFCTVYTRRGEVLRIISLRKANAQEVRRWLGSE